MCRYKVRLTAYFRRDFDEIMYYIEHACHNPHGAKVVSTRTQAAIADLADNPHAHPVYYESPFYEDGIHAFIAGKYRIFYRINEALHLVRVLRIVHAARHMTTLAGPGSR